MALLGSSPRCKAWWSDKTLWFNAATLEKTWVFHGCPWFLRFKPQKTARMLRFDMVSPTKMSLSGLVLMGMWEIDWKSFFWTQIWGVSRQQKLGLEDNLSKKEEMLRNRNWGEGLGAKMPLEPTRAGDQISSQIPKSEGQFCLWSPTLFHYKASKPEPFHSNYSHFCRLESWWLTQFPVTYLHPWRQGMHTK